MQTLFQHNKKETLYRLTINVTKKIKRYIQVFLVIVFIASIQQVLKAEQETLLSLDTEEYNILIDSIDNTNKDIPIFKLNSKSREICIKSNLCGPGNHENYIRIKSLVVFKGTNKSRYDKKSILWELKFIDYAPSVISYGKKPSNAKEIIKPKKLSSTDAYSVCIYTNNNGHHCSRWTNAK